MSSFKQVSNLREFFIRLLPLEAKLLNQNLHWLPHLLYALYIPFLFRNRLITHDGMISIQRGFTRKEWKSLLQKANIQNYQVEWCYPFRWRIILWKNNRV